MSCKVITDRLFIVALTMELERLSNTEAELEFYYSILEECKTIQNEIKPFNNKDNVGFIKEYVFLDHDDIEGIDPSKKQILLN